MRSMSNGTVGRVYSVLDCLHSKARIQQRVAVTNRIPGVNGTKIMLYMS
jgi:hypothetical protein